MITLACLYFKFGTMGCGKSYELLKVAHNYEEQSKRVMLFTSAVADRDGKGIIASRATLEDREAILVDWHTNIYNIVEEQIFTEQGWLSCVLIDEVQFLQRHHITQLTRIVDGLDIPVMAYGLKNDFRNELFEGSAAMLLMADKIEEIKTICWYCDKKATMVLRFKDGQPVYEGEQIQTGGNETYKPVCRKCYHYPERRIMGVLRPQIHPNT